MDYTYEVTLDITGEVLALIQGNDDTFNYRSKGTWLEVPDPDPGDDDDESLFYDREIQLLRPESAEEFITLWDRLDGRVPRLAAESYIDHGAIERISRGVLEGPGEAASHSPRPERSDLEDAPESVHPDDPRTGALAAVRAAVDLLASGYKSEDIDEAPFSNVDGRIKAALRMTEEHLTGPDPDYPEKMDRLDPDMASEASMDELSTWFTYIVRGERFSYGHIAGFVDDGVLQTLFERLLELLNAATPADKEVFESRGREPKWYFEDGRKFSYSLMGLPGNETTVVAMCREEALEDPETGELDESVLDKEFRVNGFWSYEAPTDEAGDVYDEFWLMYVSREAIQIWDVRGPGCSVDDFRAFLS